MNPVVHFEMPAQDRKRMGDFYANVFGWNIQHLGPEMMDYVVVHTAETDENNMVKQPGAINGGFYQRTEDPALNAPSVVISVNNIRDHIKKVTAAGGKILGHVMPISGIGDWVSFIDTEGNRVSMLQPKGI